MPTFSELKFKIVTWLAPGLIAEVDRLRFFAEAIHDLHMVPVPYNEFTLDQAFQNAKFYEPELIAGRATIQDRQLSLLEVLKRLEEHGPK